MIAVGSGKGQEPGGQRPTAGRDRSLSRVVLPLDMAFQLVRVEIDVAQRTGRVPARLVPEMRRRGVAALAAGADGFGAHARAELDHRDEAVAAGAVHLLRARIRACAERGE